MRKPLYIIENQETGEVYDFFDFTWNASIQDCIAPYTTRATAEVFISYIKSISGHFVQIGWLD